MEHRCKAAFAFSDRPYVLEKLTTEHAAVIQSLATLHAYGRTAIYDSLTDMPIYLAKSP